MSVHFCLFTESTWHNFKHIVDIYLCLLIHKLGASIIVPPKASRRRLEVGKAGSGRDYSWYVFLCQHLEHSQVGKNTLFHA